MWLRVRNFRYRGAQNVDWTFVFSQGLTLAVLDLLVVFSVTQDAARLHLLKSTNAAWGNDFRGGLWPASAAILRGASPYPPATLHVLAGLPHTYVWPPLMAVLGVPLAHAPYWLAIGLWNIVCGAAFVAALWIFGVRDWRMYVLGIASFPFQESLFSGQPEGLQLLALAAAWRHRQSATGGVALGIAIAAKLVTWPLFFWLVATRRYKAACWTVVVAGAGLVGSWGLIGFRGMLGYPHLLSLDAQVGERSPDSMSAVSLFLHLGCPASLATGLSVALGVVIAIAVIRLRGRNEEAWFTAAVAASLFFSPLMWTHYLVIVFAPLALDRSRSIGRWLTTALLWIWLPTANYEVRASVTLATAAALMLWPMSRKDDGESSDDPRLPAFRNAVRSR